jgi:hypothetical protein
MSVVLLCALDNRLKSLQDVPSGFSVKKTFGHCAKLLSVLAELLRVLAVELVLKILAVDLVKGCGCHFQS